MPSLEILLTTVFLVLGPSPAPRATTLTAADGVAVHADYYPASSAGAPIILLFHQARSNRGEYRSIAPRLVARGFAALALDQRSGDARWGLSNQTVDGLGHSTGYLEALPDLEAALVWAQRQAGATGTVVVWGSSYSAALVFLLAARHPDEIDALLAFSPGEYLAPEGIVAEQAARLDLPVLILAPPSERARAGAIYQAVSSRDKKLEIPRQAVHGSSMLITERNAAAASIWPVVDAFLARLKPTGTSHAEEHPEPD